LAADFPHTAAIRRRHPERRRRGSCSSSKFVSH